MGVGGTVSRGGRLYSKATGEVVAVSSSKGGFTKISEPYVPVVGPGTKSQAEASRAAIPESRLGSKDVPITPSPTPIAPASTVTRTVTSDRTLAALPGTLGGAASPRPVVGEPYYQLPTGERVPASQATPEQRFKGAVGDKPWLPQEYARTEEGGEQALGMSDEQLEAEIQSRLASGDHPKVQVVEEIQSATENKPAFWKADEATKEYKGDVQSYAMALKAFESKSPQTPEDYAKYTKEYTRLEAWRRDLESKGGFLESYTKGQAQNQLLQSTRPEAAREFISPGQLLADPAKLSGVLVGAAEVSGELAGSVFAPISGEAQRTGARLLHPTWRTEEAKLKELRDMGLEGLAISRESITAQKEYFKASAPIVIASIAAMPVTFPASVTRTLATTVTEGPIEAGQEYARGLATAVVEQPYTVLGQLVVGQAVLLKTKQYFQRPDPIPELGVRQIDYAGRGDIRLDPFYKGRVDVGGQVGYKSLTTQHAVTGRGTILTQPTLGQKLAFIETGKTAPGLFGLQAEGSIVYSSVPLTGKTIAFGLPLGAGPEFRYIPTPEAGVVVGGGRIIMPTTVGHGAAIPSPFERDISKVRGGFKYTLQERIDDAAAIQRFMGTKGRAPGLLQVTIPKLTTVPATSPLRVVFTPTIPAVATHIVPPPILSQKEEERVATAITPMQATDLVKATVQKPRAPIPMPVRPMKTIIQPQVIEPIPIRAITPMVGTTPAQATQPRLITPTIPRVQIPRPDIPRPDVFRAPVITTASALILARDQRFRQPEGFTKAFQAFAKVKGKFIKVGGPAPKTKALRMGKEFVQKTPARTFTIKEAGATREKDFGSIDLKQFYEKKGTFIERTKYAIDTIGEFRGITLKGIQAPRKKTTKKRKSKSSRRKTTVNRRK